MANLKELLAKQRERLDEADKKASAASAHKYAKDLLKHHGYFHHSSETTKGSHKSWFNGQFNPNFGAYETVVHKLSLKKDEHFPDTYHGKVHGHHVSLHKTGSGAFLETHKTDNSRAGIDEETLDEADKSSNLKKTGQFPEYHKIQFKKHIAIMQAYHSAGEHTNASKHDLKAEHHAKEYWLKTGKHLE